MQRVNKDASQTQMSFTNNARVEHDIDDFCLRAQTPHVILEAFLDEDNEL